MQTDSSCFLLRGSILLHFTTSEILKVLLGSSTELCIRRLGVVKHGSIPDKDDTCPSRTVFRRTRRRMVVWRRFFYGARRHPSVLVVPEACSTAMRHRARPESWQRRLPVVERLSTPLFTAPLSDAERYVDIR